jgi:hypothetical protein
LIVQIREKVTGIIYRITQRGRSWGCLEVRRRFSTVSAGTEQVPFDRV